jgi:hypothetical protein
MHVRVHQSRQYGAAGKLAPLEVRWEFGRRTHGGDARTFDNHGLLG